LLISGSGKSYLGNLDNPKADSNLLVVEKIKKMMLLAQANNPNAADGRDLLVLSSRLPAAADLSRL
jgi:hypothetical protein